MLATIAIAVCQGPGDDQLRAYHGYRSADTDTVPTRDGARAATASTKRDASPVGTAISGFLSPWGLPPVPANAVVTDTGLVFRSADDAETATNPAGGPRSPADRQWRATAVSLAYVSADGRTPTYLFRLDGGVFATELPGQLLDLAAHPRWRDRPGLTEWDAARAPATAASIAAAQIVVRTLTRSTYADSLYALFGRPKRTAGLVGPKGAAVGRLGEYIASRDSVALDPARITSEAQLPHALAHELAHRWQARSRVRVAALWQAVTPIRDKKRYGYGSTPEHQAEAAAFAVHFLQTTAASSAPTRDVAALLDAYELLVPGTRLLAGHFVRQPIYRRHPLRAAFTDGRLK